MSKSAEEQIAEYDKRRDMHYYVYFSSSTYTWKVDVLQFKKKSDIKNEYYRDKKYYSTYANAKAVAAKLNAADTNTSHLIGRAVHNFRSELFNLKRDIEAEKRVVSQCELEAINVLEDTTSLINRLLNNQKDS